MARNYLRTVEPEHTVFFDDEDRDALSKAYGTCLAIRCKKIVIGQPAPHDGPWHENIVGYPGLLAIERMDPTDRLVQESRRAAAILEAERRGRLFRGDPSS